MRFQYLKKITGLSGVMVLFLCANVLIGEVSATKEIIRKGVMKECKEGPLILKEVRLEEKQVMRSSSTHFVLDLMMAEVVDEGGELEPGLTGQPALPKVFSLSQNYPNPFNPTTTIVFEVPGEVGEEKQVKLVIYNIRGKQVKRLIDSAYEPGSHRVVWNGRNDDGEQVSSGIYLYTLRNGDQSYTKKMVMMK